MRRLVMCRHPGRVLLSFYAVNPRKDEVRKKWLQS